VFQPHLVIGIGYWVSGLAEIHLPSTYYAVPGGWAVIIPLPSGLESQHEVLRSKTTSLSVYQNHFYKYGAPPKILARSTSWSLSICTPLTMRAVGTQAWSPREHRLYFLRAVRYAPQRVRLFANDRI